MSLFELIIALVLCGVIMYCINRWVPMEPRIKNILNIAVIIILVLWLCHAFGLFDALKNIHITKP